MNALLEKREFHPSGDLWKWRTRDAELTFEDYDLEGRPRLTKQKRYADHSGFGSATVRDEFSQTHEWNAHGERKAWTMPGTATRIDETYDAEGNVQTIRRGGALLMSADYRRRDAPPHAPSTPARRPSSARTATTPSAACLTISP